MKKFRVNTAKNKLHKLWSEYIRKRDGVCQWCKFDGKLNAKALQAHHIVSKAIGGNACRFDVDNGMALCYHHHLDKLKQCVDEYTAFRDNWLADRGLTYHLLRERYQGVILKLTPEEYAIKKQVLEELLAEKGKKGLASVQETAFF